MGFFNGRTNGLFTKGLKHYNAGHYTEALEWFERAAESNDVNAMFNIGIIY